VRSFARVREHIQKITNRWARLSCQVPQIKPSGKRLADRAMCHSSDAFFGCDDPLEPVIFSALYGIRKLYDGGSAGVDP